MIHSSNLEALVTGHTLLIDSNIIIYLTDSVEPYANVARLIFEMVEAGRAQAVVSILSIAEVMQGPISMGRQPLAQEVRDYLVNFPNCHCQEITQPVLETFGNDERIAWNRLRTVDGLIIASGLAAGADIFVSNDRHFIQSVPDSMLISFFDSE
jgi:predicted nucleic acid-binding protein